MGRLRLPQLLEGGWTNAVFVTYGLNLVDFENAFWPALGAQCRNKVILADGAQYLRAMSGYAESGLVHSVNQRYVTAGIFAPRIAHAKFILLTNELRGRLLVGSGNLSITGYASGGEQFVLYEYEENQQYDLLAFKQADDFLRRLVEDGYVGEPVGHHLDHLRRETRWLHQPGSNDFQPLCHNLDRSYLESFQDALAHEEVLRLTIMSPFFDERAYALERLLVTLKPRTVRLLLQREQTSVDPEQLRRVWQTYDGEVEIYSINTDITPTPYFHNKLYLAETSSRAICLQGSPNLSVVAMLWSVAQGGNIELANLLTGSPDDFAATLEPLELQTLPLETESLPFTYQGSVEVEDTPRVDDEESVHLLGGELLSHEIILQVDGVIPPPEIIALYVDDQVIEIAFRVDEDNALHAPLTEVLAVRLSRLIPVRLAWQFGDDWRTSNPIFLYNRPLLDKELQSTTTQARPERFGGLDLGDEEVEHLLEALQSDLLLDRRSVWQTLNQPSPASDRSDEDGPRLSYNDIDFGALKRHPRMQQYARGLGRSRFGRSRLQLMLSSISSRFNGLVDMLVRGEPLTPKHGQGDLFNERMSDSAEELEELEERQEQRRWSTNARIRQVFRGFINRYLRGLASRDFQEVVGHEVMSHNFIIFNHLLCTLLHKAWYSDHEHELLETLHQTWTLWWGDRQTKGYFHTFSKEQRADFYALAEEYHLAGYMLAAVYAGEQLTRDNQSLRVTLRDCWRSLLAQGVPACTKKAVEDAWILVAGVQPVEPPRPTQIIQAQKTLCDFVVATDMRSALEKNCGLESGRFNFGPVSVRREGFGREVAAICLFIHDPENLPDADRAKLIIKTWMAVEELDYYRVASPLVRTQRLAFYDVIQQRGLFYDWDTGEEVSLEDLASQPDPWHDPLRAYSELALIVDREMSVDLTQLLQRKIDVGSTA